MENTTNIYCQSCGMPLDVPDRFGTNFDGEKNSEYCFYCLKDGQYTVDYSMEKMIEIWAKYSKEFNRYCGTNYSEEEIASLLKKRLPQLKRWRQKRETNDIYRSSLNRVIEYIDEHLFEDMSLKTIAEKANLSEYHFHRIFKALTGEKLGSYVRRLRMEFVAHQLLTTDQSLTQIVTATSYQNIHTLSKGFKKHFGITPIEYRTQNDKIKKRFFSKNVSEHYDEPRFVRVKDLKIAYLNIGDAYRNITAYRIMWANLEKFAEENNLKEADTHYVSVSFNDPTITSFDRCRFYIGITLKKEIKPGGRFGVMSVLSGDYLVFGYKGSYTSLPELYAYIYLKYLPNGKYRLRNTFSFEIYLNTPKEVPADMLETEVYIPVEKR